MIKKRYLFIPLAALMIGVLVIGVAGYVLLSRKGSDTVAMSIATLVGLPNGPATKKRIGSAGGSIASPDGRIVVDVPPDALPGPLDFSVQPITNLASEHGTFNFTPGNGLSGSCTSCKYTVTGTDTVKTGIEVTGGSTGTLLGLTKSGGGSIHIDLVPLETNECNQ
jgi:hypothetical protein